MLLLLFDAAVVFVVVLLLCCCCVVVLPGESVPLKTKNDLLALVAYFGVDSSDDTPSSPPTRSFTDISWWVKGGEEGSSQVSSSSSQDKCEDVTTDDSEENPEVKGTLGLKKVSSYYGIFSIVMTNDAIRGIGIIILIIMSTKLFL